MVRNDAFDDYGLKGSGSGSWQLPIRILFKGRATAKVTCYLGSFLPLFPLPGLSSIT